MTPYEREILIRTIMGEADDAGPEGWAAVAHVIRNRMADPRWPGNPASVALQPMQFSAWNEKRLGGNDLVNRKATHPQFQKVGAVVDQVWQGKVPDPTGGATHYYAPAGMPDRREPKWFLKATQERGEQPTRIGGHIFTGRAAGTPRRPHSQTPGMSTPQYKPDSPYYRQPPPDQAPVIPAPRAKPKQPGFDWQGAISGLGGLVGAMQPDQRQDEERQIQLSEMARFLDEAARKRREWDQRFSWL